MGILPQRTDDQDLSCTGVQNIEEAHPGDLAKCICQVVHKVA